VMSAAIFSPTEFGQPALGKRTDIHE